MPLLGQSLSRQHPQLWETRCWSIGTPPECKTDAYTCVHHCWNICDLVHPSATSLNWLHNQILVLISPHFKSFEVHWFLEVTLSLEKVKLHVILCEKKTTTLDNCAPHKLQTATHFFSQSFFTDGLKFYRLNTNSIHFQVENFDKLIKSEKWKISAKNKLGCHRPSLQNELSSPQTIF